MKRLTLVLLALVFAFGTFSCQTEDTPEPQTQSTPVDSTDQNTPIDTVFEPSKEKQNHLTADTAQGKIFYVKQGALKSHRLVFTLSQPGKLRVTDTSDNEVLYDIYHFKGDTVGFKHDGSGTVKSGKSMEGIYTFDYTSEDSLLMTFLSDSLGRTASVQTVGASTSINTSSTDTSGNGGTDTTGTGIVDSTLTNFAQDLYFKWNLDTASSTIRDTSFNSQHDNAYIEFEKNGDEVKVTLYDGNILSVHKIDSVSIKDGSILGHDYIIQSFKDSNPVLDYYLPYLQATTKRGWYINVINQNTIKIEPNGTLGCGPCDHTELIFTK